jgi:hypothetical protein
MEREKITELVQAVKDPQAKAALAVILDMVAQSDEAYQDLLARCQSFETELSEIKRAFEKGTKPA